MKKIIIALSLSALPAFAQTNFNDGGQDSSWGNSSNWSNGVPISTSAVTFDVSPSGDLVGLDVGGPVTIGSLTFGSGVSSSFDIVPLLDETLQVNGALTNSSSFTPSFGLPFNVGGNATWTGNLKFANTLNVDLRTVTLAPGASILLTPGNNLNFQITNITTFGKFAGTGSANFNGVIINLAGTFANAALGNTFDFTTGSFTGATLNVATLPTLADPVNTKWDLTGFQSNGVIAVVSAIPEPSTWAAIAGVASLGFAALRRRRIA